MSNFLFVNLKGGGFRNCGGQAVFLVSSVKKLPMNSQASSRGVGEPGTGAEVKKHGLTPRPHSSSLLPG